MPSEGTPRSPRPRYGRIAMLAMGAFALTAAGLTAAIRSIDSDAATAVATAPAVRAPAAANDHATHDPGATAALAEAPRTR